MKKNKEPKKKYKVRPYTLGEEIANSISHGVGALLAIAALVLLIVYSALRGSAWHVVSFTIYGSMMILVYMSSTLYHALTHKTAKKVFHILDHSAIFLLIAGTYTPFALVALRGPLGWSIFGVEWGFAILGIVFKSLYLEKSNLLMTVISIVVYIVMGWMALIAIKPLLEVMSINGLIFLFSGGLCYTLGVVFFAWKKMPYHHFIWHLFVLAGTILHFFCIILYVLPIK